jgi:hypothetical protein
VGTVGVDPEVGSSALRLWIAAGSAALLVTACVLAFARAKTAPLQALERLGLTVIAAALGAVMAWAFLDRAVGRDYGADRRALELRAEELTAHALAPGSALPCLDAVAGDDVETACEKSLFASAASVAVATSYVTARLALLSDITAYVKHGGGEIDSTLLPLRRAVEADRYGFLAHALAVRDGCTSQNCKAFTVLSDVSHIRDNLSAATFDDYLSRYLTAWSQPADTPVADAAAQPGPQASHKIVNIDFPTAASIPAVSIMNPEPTGKAASPAAAANANPAAAADAQTAAPKKGRKQAANPPPQPSAVADPQVDPVWTPAPAATQSAAAPAAPAGPAANFASSPSAPMQLMPQTSPQ